MDDFKPLLQKLIACRTIAGNEHELAAGFSLIEREFAPYFQVRRWRGQGATILILSTSRRRELDLIIAGHLDVVPAPLAEFSLRERAGRYYGRGVCDMKGPLAACLYALRDWSQSSRQKKTAAIVISADEEIGGGSIHHFLAKSAYRAKFALVPDDGSEREIVVREKGRLQLELAVRGRSAHAAVPHEGENPIERLFALYTWLHRKFPPPRHAQDWRTSVVLTKVAAGQAVNQIPDCAAAGLDVRYARVEDRERVLKVIRHYLGRPTQCRILNENNLFTVSKHNPYVRQLARSIRHITGKTPSFVSAAGTSDAHAFSAAGIPAALFSPVGGGIHQSREWVSIASLARFYEIVKNFLENF